MARSGNKYVAYALAISLLASGVYELVHGWFFGNMRAASWVPGITKTAMAEGDVEKENHTFSLFSESTAEALKANAKEGATITFSGSDDAYIFVSEAEDAVTWTIDKKGISVTVGSEVGEDGKRSDYIVMNHSDSKKRITRSLKQMVSEDGEHAYLISKTNMKGTVEYPLTAEQLAGAEQEFNDSKSFDLLFDATKKAIERANVLYLFSQETFDYLEEHWKAGVIKYPDKKDTYIICSRCEGRDSITWYFNNQGLQISYGFEKDEEGKKNLIAVALYNYVPQNAATWFFNDLFVDYRGEEPFYSIRKTNNSLPMEDENRTVEYPLTPDQFAWAFTQFKKSPKSFDSIFKKAPNRSSLDGDITWTGSELCRAGSGQS